MTLPVRLSVILPVKNGERHLTQALETIERNCTEEDELIVIDDQSIDGTARLLQSFKPAFRVTLLQGAGQGPAKARNDGLAIAQGRYITFLDHDDCWPDHRVFNHLAVLESEVSADVVMGQVEYVTGLHRDHLPAFVNHYPVIFHVHLGASTFRRSIFETVGWFDEQLGFSEDHDLFLRIREAGLIIHPLHEISLRYRIHETNMTRSKRLDEMQLLHVIQKSLSRRRVRYTVLSPFPKNGSSLGS